MDHLQETYQKEKTILNHEEEDLYKNEIKK